MVPCSWGKTKMVRETWYVIVFSFTFTIADRKLETYCANSWRPAIPGGNDGKSNIMLECTQTCDALLLEVVLNRWDQCYN